MRKYVIAAFAAVAVFAISAFAASLQVDAGTLQAGAGEIDTCTDDDVTATYGDPQYDAGSWLVTEIQLTYDAACGGLAFDVVVSDGEDVALASDSGILATPPDGAETGTHDLTFEDGFDATEAAWVHVAVRTPTSS